MRFEPGDELKKPFYHAAGALLLTATMTMAAMAGPKEGTPAADGNRADRAGGVGERASAARAGNPGSKAKSEPAGNNAGGSPAAPAVAAWIALFKSFETNLMGYESAPPESPLPDAKPFTLY